MIPFLALLLPLAAAAPNPADIHPGPVVQWKPGDGGNGHFYQAVSVDPGNGISWTDANAYAQGRQGYLATIASQNENDFVFALIDDAKYWRLTSTGRYLMGPWLGGSRTPGSKDPKTNWSWAKKDEAFSYSNWSPGQPDNSDGHEDSLEFYSINPSTRSPQWNDTDTDNPKKGFIIEFDRDPRPPPPGAPIEPIGSRSSPLFLPLAAASALAVLILLIGLFIFLARRPRKSDRDQPPFLD